MAFLLRLHGEVRWLFAVAAVVAMVRFAYGLARKADYKGLDRGLMAALTGLLDLNFVLGLVLLIMLGGLTTPRLEHIATMILAVAAAHASAAWRRSDNAALKFRNNLMLIVAVSALVVLGVVRLRGSWLF